MRILGIGLLTILILALLRFAFLQPDVQNLVGFGNADRRVQHNLVSRIPESSCAGGAQGNTHTFVVRESDTWTALTGSPGYASASFNMPKEVSVVNGTLILDLRAELQVGSVGRMRINVNGERRGEIILADGINSNTIRLNLLPSDLTQSQLHVTLGAFANFPNLSCRRDWNGGMIVRIEPTSRVELTTNGPLTDLNDRLRATGNPYHIAWPSEPNGNEYERLISFGVDQRLRDIRTEFVPDTVQSCPVAVGLSARDLEAASDIVDNAVHDMRDATWPVSIAAEGPNAEARFFEYETVWRHAYDLRHTPNAEYPTEFALGMRAIGLQPDAQWLLSVSLNETVIFAEKFEGDTLDLNRRIELPFDLHAFSNTLEIRLISSERQNQQECTSGSPITAQLKRSTMLFGGVAAPDESIGEFINALNGPLQLDVSGKLNPAEASSAVVFLAEAFGERVQWNTAGNQDPEMGYVLVSTRSELEDNFKRLKQERAGQHFWLVSPTLPDEGELPYRQIKLDDLSLQAFESGEGSRIAAIVAIKALEIPDSVPTLPETVVPSVETQTELPEEGGETEEDTPSESIDAAPVIESQASVPVAPVQE